ncbi:hypothetical protein C2G38_2034115 [Gigaspora rosea]|uniref:Serine-threonine/tyrosine-protein kinase catalytic domain-containing protein n=1 Tax=Gigaspora rosea TaxID=44941 RepID=A0A397VH32_9GLOM|nr:hypothetical protein C2G38_2034115 [Gigaspora rosea]
MMGFKNLFVELAKLCMDSDLQKRPTAETIHNKLSEWHSFVKESAEFDESDEIDVLDKYDKRNEFNESNEYHEKLKIANSASIISVENPVVNHRSKRQKPDQESHYMQLGSPVIK